MIGKDFQVSARKYRPRHFDYVIGQEHITTTLRKAIQTGRVAHAYLFFGPRGVGKTTCARILAKTINCENLSDQATPCDACSSCASFRNNANFNIIELDAASHNSVDKIRAINEQARFPPQGGKYKIYILDEVHMLSAAAANAFLKTLEEPPDNVIFILATTEKHKILPTIISRCQFFDFRRIEAKEMCTYLEEIAHQEGVQYENAALELIARQSEGCMRDALTLFDKVSSFSDKKVTYTNTLEHLNLLDDDFYCSLFAFFRQGDFASALSTAEQTYQKGFEPEMILDGICVCFRNLLLCQNKIGVHLLTVTSAYQRQYDELADSLGLSFLLSGLSLATQAQVDCRSCRDKKLFLDLFLIKLSFLKDALKEEDSGASGQVYSANHAAVSYRALPLHPYLPIPHRTEEVGKPLATERKATPKQSSLVVPPLASDAGQNDTSLCNFDTLLDVQKAAANRPDTQGHGHNCQPPTIGVAKECPPHTEDIEQAYRAMVQRNPLVRDLVDQIGFLPLHK